LDYTQSLLQDLQARAHDVCCKPPKEQWCEKFHEMDYSYKLFEQYVHASYIAHREQRLVIVEIRPDLREAKEFADASDVNSKICLKGLEKWCYEKAFYLGWLGRVWKKQRPFYCTQLRSFLELRKRISVEHAQNLADMPQGRELLQSATWFTEQSAWIYDDIESFHECGCSEAVRKFAGGQAYTEDENIELWEHFRTILEVMLDCVLNKHG